jgi:hypothetical protein
MKVLSTHKIPEEEIERQVGQIKLQLLLVPLIALSIHLFTAGIEAKSHDWAAPKASKSQLADRPTFSTNTHPLGIFPPAPTSMSNFPIKLKLSPDPPRSKIRKPPWNSDTHPIKPADSYLPPAHSSKRISSSSRIDPIRAHGRGTPRRRTSAPARPLIYPLTREVADIHNPYRAALEATRGMYRQELYPIATEQALLVVSPFIGPEIERTIPEEELNDIREAIQNPNPTEDEIHHIAFRQTVYVTQGLTTTILFERLLQEYAVQFQIPTEQLADFIRRTRAELPAANMEWFEIQLEPGNTLYNNLRQYVLNEQNPLQALDDYLLLGSVCQFPVERSNMIQEVTRQAITHIRPKFAFIEIPTTTMTRMFQGGVEQHPPLATESGFEIYTCVDANPTYPNPEAIEHAGPPPEEMGHFPDTEGDQESVLASIEEE